MDLNVFPSPGWMHETSARGWCTGKTQRDRVEREVGGGIGMGNTYSLFLRKEQQQKFIAILFPKKKSKKERNKTLLDFPTVPVVKNPLCKPGDQV